MVAAFLLATVVASAPPLELAPGARYDARIRREVVRVPVDDDGREIQAG